MAYMYSHFIPQNTAPNGAKSIAVYKDNSKICSIPLGRMKPHTGEKLYSFGLVSDIHLYHLSVGWNPNEKFDNVLSYFENAGCSMCVVAGDLTQTGFYLKNKESDTTETPHIDLGQMAKYKEICDNHTIPVYEIAGNHECYYGMAVTNNLDLWETYTGKRELSYSVLHGNDLFIFCGQPSAGEVMSQADLVWLSNTLEANKNKRCFVFVHSYIEEDSGDPTNTRENSIFEMWGTANTNTFVNLLAQYPNVLLFHGHSHTKFECQESDINANYTEINGFKSVHIPSLGRPRDIESTELFAESQGYLIDVYPECIVLNGMDFINNTVIPIGVYKINIAEGV